MDQAPRNADRRQCHICTATESGAFCRLFLYDDLGNKVVTPGEWRCKACQKWYRKHLAGGQKGRQHCGRSRGHELMGCMTCMHNMHACSLVVRASGLTQTT